MLWFVPLERLQERYTAQMYNWVIDGFKRKNVAYDVIEGKALTSSVETGEVLDAEGTNYYKATQLMKICQLFKSGEIKDGDIFFIGDLWFPGIEMIRYIATQKKMNQIWIAGVHYAGVFDPNDFVYKMREWAKYNETGWLQLADWVFVGSEYHKGLILEGLENEMNEFNANIFPTGLVWDADCVKSDIKQKERIVIFPHRTDAEKNPELFFEVAKEVRKVAPDVRFVITSSRKSLSSNIPNFKVPDFIELKVGLTKQQYYDELAKAKVLFSSAVQETFGYALNEGLTLGCIPICPRRCSYPEVLEDDGRLLYDTVSEAVTEVLLALNSTVDWDVSRYTDKYSKNIDDMLEIMGL